MTEPVRLLSMPLDKFLSEAAPSAGDTGFAVLWNGTAYIYPYASKAAAKTFWATQAGWISWYDFSDGASMAITADSGGGYGSSIKAVAPCADGWLQGFSIPGWSLSPMSFGVPETVVFSRALRKFFAANGNQILSSIDGITWTLAYAVSTGTHWLSIAHAGGSRLVAFDPVAGRTATSDDGVTWVERVNTGSAQTGNIIGGNGVFIIGMTDGGAESTVTVSHDGGVTWAAVVIHGLYNFQPHCMQFAGGKFCLGWSSHADASPDIYTSLDGVTFTRVAVQPPLGTSGVAGFATDGAGKWLIAATDTTVCYSTDNMATWATLAGLPHRPYQIMHSASLGFVVVGESRMIKISSDPAGGWTSPAIAGTGSDINGVAAVDE